MCEEEGTTHVHEVVWTALIVHACMYLYVCLLVCYVYLCCPNMYQIACVSDCHVTRMLPDCMHMTFMTPLDHTQWKCLSDASHVLCGEFHDSV